MKQKNTILSLGITMLTLFFGFFALTKILAQEYPIISVDFSRGSGPISNKIFGQGLEIPFLKKYWDKDSGFNQELIDITKEMGFTNIRFGGNTCKQFDWKEAMESGFESLGQTYYENIDEWVEYSRLMGGAPLNICTNLHLLPENSADLVRYANIENNYNIIDWEMGNEEYIGDGYQAFNTAAEYIEAARNHCSAMKAVDPDIKCGIHNGTIQAAAGEAWTDQAIFSAIRPGEFDFLVDHNYQPNDYFNFLAIFSSETRVDQQVSLEAGKYKIGLHAIGDQAPAIEDPIPTLQICADSACQLIDIDGPTKDWYYYSTDYFDIGNSGQIRLTMEIYDDYYDYATKQDKNIFLADVRIVREDGSILQPIDVVDRSAWTYSFLASNLVIEDEIDEFKTKMDQYGLNLPIYVTEYGWKYGNIAYPEAGVQYDWRSGLFDVLLLQSLIKKNVPQANLWTDMTHDNWRYYTNDEKGPIFWPRYYVFKLIRQKTGDTLVDVQTSDMPVYDAAEFTTPAKQGVPYLSIIASAKADKKYINVVNRHQQEAIKALIETNPDYSKVKVYEIAPSSIESHPYRDDEYKESINIDEKIISINGNFNYSFKPFSVTTFEFDSSDIIIDNQDTDDADGDMIKNIYETAAGTDPNNPLSFPTFEAVYTYNGYTAWRAPKEAANHDLWFSYPLYNYSTTLNKIGNSGYFLFGANEAIDPNITWEILSKNDKGDYIAKSGIYGIQSDMAPPAICGLAYNGSRLSWNQGLTGTYKIEYGNSEFAADGYIIVNKNILESPEINILYGKYIRIQEMNGSTPGPASNTIQIPAQANPDKVSNISYNNSTKILTWSDTGADYYRINFLDYPGAYLTAHQANFDHFFPGFLIEIVGYKNNAPTEASEPYFVE